MSTVGPCEVVEALTDVLCGPCPIREKCAAECQESDNGDEMESNGRLIQCLRKHVDRGVTTDSSCPACGEDVSDELNEACGCKDYGTFQCPNKKCKAEIEWGSENAYRLEVKKPLPKPRKAKKKKA